MANIRIDPDTMNTRAGQFRSIGAEIDGLVGKMDSLLGMLQGEWEGQASQAYASRYNSELKPNFQRARDLANEIGAALDRTAMQMREQDQAIAHSFAG